MAFGRVDACNPLRPVDVTRMAETPSMPANPTLVLRNVDVALLSKLLQMQRRDGAATVGLIEASQPATPPHPHEDGKGCLVDCVA
jgi:hypothetical protein